MARFLKFLLILLCISRVVNALDLNDVLCKVYESNNRLKSAREELKITDERIMDALSGWMPTIQGAVNHISMQIKKFEGVAGDDRLSSGVVKNLTVTQNIFRGGEDIAAMRAAKHAIKLGRSKLIKDEQEILVNTVELYLKVLQWEELYSLSLTHEAQAKKYAAGIRQKFSAGQNTRSDVARADAEVASSIAATIQIYGNYKILQESFLGTTGLAPQNLSVPTTADIVLPKTIDEAMPIIMKNNPDLNMAISNYEVANSEIGRNLARLLPKVNLVYQIFDNTNARTLYGNSDSRGRHLQEAKISIDIPLFDGGKTWSNVRNSKRKEKQQRYALEDLRQNMKKNSVSAWQLFESAKAIFTARAQEFEATKIYYDGVLAEEKAGLKDIMEVITTRTQYFKSCQGFLEARTEYFKALYTLKAHLGECTAQGLGLKVHLYDPTENYNQIKWQLISGYTGD